MLNDFFASVLTKETDIDTSLAGEHVENVDNVLKDICWDPMDVRCKLCLMKGDKASDPDMIIVNVLRNCLDFDISLCLLYNQRIQLGMQMFLLCIKRCKIK